MTVDEKIKTIDDKIEQTQAQYNLDRQTAKIFALSSGNVDKYQFLTDQKFYQRKSCYNKRKLKIFH